MHTVELLEEALEIAQRLGYQIRHEWLGATGGGGVCEFAGRRWIFVDLALNRVEQLEQVTLALQADPSIYQTEMSPHLQSLLNIRRAA